MTMAAYHRTKYPEINLLFAIPNGGTRITREAVALRRQGVKSGVPDLCLPVARGGYHGWWGEMKRLRSGHLSPEQRDWITRLRREGYWAGWHRGADEMLADLLWYLSLPQVEAARNETYTRPFRPIGVSTKARSVDFSRSSG